MQAVAQEIATVIAAEEIKKPIESIIQQGYSELKKIPDEITNYAQHEFQQTKRKQQKLTEAYTSLKKQTPLKKSTRSRSQKRKGNLATQLKGVRSTKEKIAIVKDNIRDARARNKYIYKLVNANKPYRKKSRFTRKKRRYRR